MIKKVLRSYGIFAFSAASALIAYGKNKSNLNVKVEVPLQAEILSPEQEVLKKFHQGQIVVKNFPEEKEFGDRWNLFLYQLKRLDRSKIRYTEEEYNHIYDRDYFEEYKKGDFKYVHMQDEVIKCRNSNEDKKHKAEKKSKGYTHTPKSSATYISQNLNTRLFDWNGRAKMGLAFDINECKIKALFRMDTFTTIRNWRSDSKEAVIQHQKYLAENKLSFSNFAAYKEYVDSGKAYGYNEVLVAYNIKGLCAIVIKDEDDAKQLALQRQAQMAVELKKVIPIVFYNPENKSVNVYTQEMQETDKERFTASPPKTIEF